MSLYINLLSTMYMYGDKSMGGEYSDINPSKQYKDHYFYQTEGNELIAFALWLGIPYVEHCPFCTTINNKGQKDYVGEYLSEKFTEFEHERNKHSISTIS